MKLLLVVATFIAMCSCNVFPSIPGNNSFNLARTSRGAWLPNRKVLLQSVDDHAPTNKSGISYLNWFDWDLNKNEYWLYTRKNPQKHQLLVYQDFASITRSNYHRSRPINVIVHGWTLNGDSEFNAVVRDAFLAVEDANVIVVDWREWANMLYPVSVLAIPKIGEYLGNFLIWLIQTGGGDWNKVHLVGYSLGAHLIGSAGRTAGGGIARITGLDPAGPGWTGNINALNKESGKYVEVIHTDCEFLGYCKAMGHADFYVNGGKNPQPNCWFSFCSHHRSTELFTASLYYNHFVGRQCHNLYEATRKVPICTGKALKMGNTDYTKQGIGLYAVSTTGTWPF